MAISIYLELKYQIITMIENGKGEIVKQDFEKAYKYVKIAADNGNEIARNHLRVFRKNLYGNYFITGY